MLKIIKAQNSIYLKPKADDDLTDIYHYSFHKFGRIKAVSYIEAIHNSFAKIIKSPEILQSCNHIKTD